MRATTIVAVALALVLALGAGRAGANGSPYSPGLAYGWPGVAAGGDGLHYVSFGMPKSTIVAAVRKRDGAVVRTRTVRGFYGVPLVAYDATSGGLSGDGRTLVLGSYGPLPGSSGSTRFAIVDTGSLSVRRLVVLTGSWSYDAVSPDASTLYLTEHVRAGDHPLYRVRPFDVRTGLLRGPLVDRLEGERDMGGVPVARAASEDGRWAYTLYARRNHGPFVHALDTAEREAFCIDLPLRLAFGKQWTLRLRLRTPTELAVQLPGGGRVATVDTRSWDVR